VFVVEEVGAVGFMGSEAGGTDGEVPKGVKDSVDGEGVEAVDRLLLIANSPLPPL